MAGLGIRQIRAADLPPELESTMVTLALAKYGTIREAKCDEWLPMYRYKVKNDITVLTVELKAHIPSHLCIAVRRAYVS
jgi:hypothetical protein